MPRKYGWKRQLPDHRDFRYRSTRQYLRLPARVNLRTAITSQPPAEPNFDQGNLGSCGPNSAALHLAFNQLVAGGAAVMPSRLFIYYATRDLMGTVSQDSGVDNRTMLKALAKFGWCEESLCPYTISKFTTKPKAAAYTAAKAKLITKYQAVDQYLTSMKECLADGLPFIFGFTVYDSFESEAVAATGVVPMPSKSEGMLGGHDVLIVGYDDATQRFDFENSWGEGWGNRGAGTIPYAYATDPNLSGDFWTIGTPAPTPPQPPAPPAPKSINLPCTFTAADGRKLELRELTT